LLFSWCPFVLWAQSPTENLEKGVEIYNALGTYVDGLSPKNLTPDNITDVKARLDKGCALLDQVIKEGNADQIKTARYFKSVFYNKYAFVLGMKGDNTRAYEIYKSIEEPMTAYTAADFPLRYIFFDKNYVIKWDNFASTQAEFLTAYGETAYNLNKYEEAARIERLALAHPDISKWLRYIAVNKLLDIAAKRSEIIPETERLNYAVQAVKSYDALREEDRKVVKDYNYPTTKRAVGLLLEDIGRKNNRESAARAAEILPIVARIDSNNVSVLQLFERCYRTGHPGDMALAQAADNYARTMQQGAERIRAEYVGITATDRMASFHSTSDCEALQKDAERYRYWKQNAKEQQALKSAEKCLEARRVAEKKAAKAAKRANNNFNFYTGAYLFPLFNTNPRRDYGGVVNFVFKKTALEFSYLKINQNKENIFDLWVREVDDAAQDNLSRWDGFYTHFQPKFMSNNTRYWGLLLGYAQKTFDPLSVNAVNEATGGSTLVNFNPSVKQYIGMFNFGGMILGKGFGLDTYIGIGGHYSQFDAGTNIDRKAYTIENPLLEHRKDWYGGLIIRVGMTVGLNFGAGRS
jgi:hypothetical protein